MKPEKRDCSFVLVIESWARRMHDNNVAGWKERLQAENGNSSDVQDE
jgi:hypothetical protein